MEAEFERQVKIKTNVLKRCLKEYNMYQDEVKKEKDKLDQMDRSHDKYNQLLQVLDESKSMVNDTGNRVQAAKADLEQLLQEELSEESKEQEIYVEGWRCIENANKILP